VPQQVIAELIDPAAPNEVEEWAQNLPEWIEVRVAVVNDTGFFTLIPASGQRSPSHNLNWTRCC
jgi:hypothetical protein